MDPVAEEEEGDRECGKGAVSPQGQAAPAASPGDVGHASPMLSKKKRPKVPGEGPSARGAPHRAELPCCRIMSLQVP